MDSPRDRIALQRMAEAYARMMKNRVSGPGDLVDRRRNDPGVEGPGADKVFEMANEGDPMAMEFRNSLYPQSYDPVADFIKQLLGKPSRLTPVSPATKGPLRGLIPGR
jgi:hypothetical protein